MRDGWTYRAEYVCCGKCKTRCAHGPYWYRYKREGKKVKKEYVGRVDDGRGKYRRDPPELDPQLGLWDRMLRKETASERVACQVLGIDQAVSRDQVFKAYRERQLRYHPDRGGSVVASQAINAAWSYLKAWYKW